MIRALQEQRRQLRVGGQHVIAKETEEALHGMGQIFDFVEREKSRRALDRVGHAKDLVDELVVDTLAVRFKTKDVLFEGQQMLAGFLHEGNEDFVVLVDHGESTCRRPIPTTHRSVADGS